jgi:hypothetical protein
MKPTMARLIPLLAAILMPASMATAGVVIDMPAAPPQPQPAEMPDQATTQPSDAASADQPDVGTIALWRYAHARTGPRDVWFPTVPPFGYYSDFIYYNGYAYRNWYHWSSWSWHGWWPRPLYFPGAIIPRVSFTIQ